MHNDCTGESLEKWQKDIRSYADMKKNPSAPGQAHHIGQNAAFRDVIPRDEGLSIQLEGNAFTEVGSPHYNAHNSMEGFWDKFRGTGTKPTVGQYNRAAYESLLSAGVSEENASSAVLKLYEQQKSYGLLNSSAVPRVPRKIYQVN